jgi:hypothetical protein
MPSLLLRRGPFVVAMTVCLGATGGCAASTISGHGSAAPIARSSGFPASTSAAPSSPAPGTPTGGGVLVVDKSGKFVVRMPAQPERSSEHGSLGNYRFTVHVDAVHEPYVVAVEGEDITPALPQDQLEDALRSAVSSFQSSSGLDLVSQTSTTFHGHQARAAILQHAGNRFELLSVGWSGNQLYLLVAPEGARFRALAASFRSTA